MIRLEPTLWLLLTLPFVAVIAYICWRGWTRNEFRVPGKNGWAWYASRSVNWWIATFVNFSFFGAALFLLGQSLFNGSAFSRQPQFPMPKLAGSRTISLNVAQTPDALARCLSEQNHGQIYSETQNTRRVVVRNGRGAVLYIFEIARNDAGSRLDIYQVSPTPFIKWSSCTNE